MKRFYSFVAMLMCALVGFSASAQETDSQAVLFAKGDLSHATLQNDANPRQNAFVEGEAAVAGAYAVVDFNAAENLFNIKAQNDAQSFYVYKNGVAVENAAAGESNMFEAQTTIEKGDVVKVYTAAPYTTKMNIGFMQTLQEEGIADEQVEVVMDKIVPVSVNELNKIFSVLEGTEFQIKAKAGYEIAAVYYCNEDVEAVDGVYTVTADREGDAMVIIDMKPVPVATVNINGFFYNVTAQDVNIDDPRAAEVFSFQPAGEIDKTVEVAVNGTKTIKLTVQNETNEIYVALNGQKVASQMDGMFQAEITLHADDVLDILDAEPATGVAIVNIKGNFMNVSAQDVNIDDPRAAEVFSFQPASAEINETVEVAVDGTKTIKLTVQNETNEVYVALNGEKVASQQDGLFQAEITLHAGDVLDILNAEPATGVATVNIKGNFWNVSAQDVNNDDPRAAEVFSFQPAGEIDETVEVAVDGAKTIKLTVQNENNEVYVALNGEKVASQQDGLFQAEITLHAGDVLDILDAEPANGVATVNIKGNFWNVSAQDVNNDDPRAAEVFSFQPAGEIDETVEVKVDGAKTIKLTVQNENNEVYVALNGQKVASQQDGLFQAEITLHAGDVLDILDAEPATGVAIVNINGNFYNVTAQDIAIDDPRAAEVFSFQPADGVLNETVEVAVNGSKTIKLSVNAPEDCAVNVTLDGEQVESTIDGMFQATIVLVPGSVLDITTQTVGINAINADASNKVYNLQGVEVKNAAKGIFIINGKKVLK